MVVEPTGVTLYVNGRGSKQSFSVDPVNFDSGSRLGNYKGWGGRFVKGSIDEACIFNKALTQAEIRELMHLTKDPAEFPNLVSYYQFNEASGVVLDKVGVRHGALVGPTVKREKSTAPVGKGVSKRLNVVAGKKRFGFDGTGLTLAFSTSSTYPNGEVVVSRLSVPPDTFPNTPHTSLTDYWILQNYGSNATFTAPTGIWFERIGSMPADLPADSCRLWRRGAVAHGPVWQYLDKADGLVEGPNAVLSYTGSNQLKTAGQFWLELPGLIDARPTQAQRSVSLTSDNTDIRIFPNPVAAGGTLQLLSAVSEQYTFRLFDAKGQQVRMLKFTGNGTLALTGLAAGIYAYRIEGGTFIRFGQVIVGR